MYSADVILQGVFYLPIQKSLKIEPNISEVQTGNYLGEDDIVRYEDVYRRDLWI